jgi:hypothetical protein
MVVGLGLGPGVFVLDLLPSVLVVASLGVGLFLLGVGLRCGLGSWFVYAKSVCTVNERCKMQNIKQLKLYLLPPNPDPKPSPNLTLTLILTLTQNHVFWHKKAKQKQKMKAANQKAAGKKNTKTNVAQKEK